MMARRRRRKAEDKQTTCEDIFSLSGTEHEYERQNIIQRKHKAVSKALTTRNNRIVVVVVVLLVVVLAAVAAAIVLAVVTVVEVAV